MGAHRLKITIPEDHHLVVEVPEDIPAGPAEILVFPQPEEREERKVDDRPSPEEALQRFEEIMARLAEDPRQFDELSDEEREARLRLIQGSGRGLFSSTDEFIRRKQEEIELEERRFAR
ncbi:MAG TPA: hypothetical protein VLQ45_33795 [Thermoanaerobaculia bacterium]|nr:hypothetical protein [Thermoanaerobaculia bacterium]